MSTLGVRFSPNIELGHIMQAIIVVGSLSGYALWGYANIETQVASLHSEVALLQQRITQDEAQGKQERDDQRSRDDRITSSLDHIADQLGDLRTIVGKADGPRR